MKGFPEFIKSAGKKIGVDQQNTDDIERYYYEDEDGVQIAFWSPVGCGDNRIDRG